ncbi:hypothetical protein CH296_27900 [Rhodococcus sp. 14-2496-1d]|uniref:hypothetical protein n=1 Tax=unclassified Rhodococcus (in: high G+C Gram-positive bacteria) TaxID=192944 RepID=UPI000B9B8474|nr:MULTISPECIES: hypothetical protein [unclassified Rhodococcus (in: high G+C Gram-positive bacteria)]OZE11899.1 hypothetical protein CH250_09390 [Rhodococcus sp. 05-2255-3C]OZE20501.1 hypothetical protein CH255_09660 [Rhodococcus sp. 05-2255-2A2]OZF25208.1 hypothetical protein CH296_27900 [Rhodococcus sp. 14-2496-1d]
MDASQISAFGGIITAVGTIIVGFLATRSNKKMDELASVQAKLDATDEELELEQAARRRDRAEMEAQHRIDRAQIEAEHEERERQLLRRISTLQSQLDEATRTITKLDRIVFAARTYIARLRRVFAERDEVPPPQPAELD